MPNQYVNHVVINGQTKLDLRNDTVDASHLAQGYTAHDASGAQITGTMTGGSVVIRDEQDSHGGTIRHITAGDVVEGTIEITENGTYDVAQYADAEVNVPAPTPSLQSKTKSYTPTETAQSETVSADSGYDGLSSVKVNVGAVSSTYVGSGIARKSSANLTMSGATVTAPAGYYAESASKTVEYGTAGTPIASKGTVSNHAISVTPSVMNVTGYINGGTKTGTAVSVSASELVSGTYTVSASGTADVTNYESISVPAQTLPTAASSTSSGTRKATISRSTSNQYINIPTGYNGSAAYYQVSAVANGTEGTPTATKGAVSNHAVSITPSVTNTAGYISGGTKTGTAVSVSASELVSGTLTISSSGTKDVTNYASASVAAGTVNSPTAIKGTVSDNSMLIVPSVSYTAGYIGNATKNGSAITVTASELVSGNKEITENGENIDVTNYATVSVNVPTGGVTQDQNGYIVLPPDGSGGGGGGASNYVHGEFHTNSTAGIQAVTIPYAGSGYPIMACVVVKGGAYASGTDWYDTVKRYAVAFWTMTKSNMASAPTYTTSGEENAGAVSYSYKDSTSSPTSYNGAGAVNINVFSSGDPTKNAYYACRFKSATSMYVTVEGSSAGLLVDTDYEYFIVYSN